MMKGNVMEMITIEKPPKPYVMLETVHAKEDNKK